MRQTKIICFGEVLWGLLPSGKIPGGAPMNVACHLQQFGISSSVISQVGNDDLATEILDFLNNKTITTDLIYRDKRFDTDTGYFLFKIKEQLSSFRLPVLKKLTFKKFSSGRNPEQITATSDCKREC